MEGGREKLFLLLTGKKKEEEEVPKKWGNSAPPSPLCFFPLSRLLLASFRKETGKADLIDFRRRWGEIPQFLN